VVLPTIYDENSTYKEIEVEGKESYHKQADDSNWDQYYNDEDCEENRVSYHCDKEMNTIVIGDGSFLTNY
jgi:hypothetical protein